MTSILYFLFLPFALSFAFFWQGSLSAVLLRRLAFAVAAAELVGFLCFPSYFQSLTYRAPFSENLGIWWDFDVVPLSYVFCALTLFATCVSIYSVAPNRLERSHLFYGLLFMGQGLLLSFFCTKDLFMFMVFWECMLLPAFIMLLIWGNRSVAMRFMLYMFAGSCLMIAAVAAVLATGGSMDMRALSFDGEHGLLIAAIFFAAFAVKTPLFPFHGWLPETYSTAPTPATIFLSSILSKAGIYGFLMVFTGANIVFIWNYYFEFATVAVAGVLYGAICALRQKDFKTLLAYSSLSHVNFILLSCPVAGSDVTVMAAINHSITIAALFLLVAFLETRVGSTEFGAGKGLAKVMPRLTWLGLTFVASSIALPGTNTFVSEFYILFYTFQASPVLGVIAGLSVILSAAYMLRFFRKIFFGEYKAPTQGHLTDLGLRPLVFGLALTALIVLLGFYPRPIFDFILPQ